MQRRLTKRLKAVLVVIVLLGMYVVGYGLVLRVLYGALAGAYPGVDSH
jgi:hypothetical protein